VRDAPEKGTKRAGGAGAAPGRAPAILRLLCPRCRRGRVFRGLFAMHPACPACGHRFEREPGYFVGAMYFSYGLAVVIYLAIAFLLHLVLPGRSDWVILAAALPAFLPFVPLLFRYGRVLWMHLDWTVDPGP
jgi:uncharacterized protein (DUF983 family)